MYLYIKIYMQNTRQLQMTQKLIRNTLALQFFKQIRLAAVVVALFLLYFGISLCRRINMQSNNFADYEPFSSQRHASSTYLHESFWSIPSFIFTPVTLPVMSIYRWSVQWSFVETSTTMRNWLSHQTISNTPTDIRSLLHGLVLGETSMFTRQEVNKLKVTGMLHVAAASGFNIGLVVLLLHFPLRSGSMPRFGRNVTLICYSLGMWWYAWLVGLEAPVVRAAGMGSFALLLVRVLGRKTSILHVVGVVLVCMLCVQSQLLLEPSFLLTAAATVGIAVFPVKKPAVLVSEADFVIATSAGEELSLQWLTKACAHYMQDAWWLSLSATVWTAPILLWFFSEFTPLGIVANIAVGWLVPQLTIFLGLHLFVTLLLSYQQTLAWFCQPLLELLEAILIFGATTFWKILDLLAKIPPGTITFPAFLARITSAIWLLCLAIFVLRRQNATRKTAQHLECIRNLAWFAI